MACSEQAEVRWIVRRDDAATEANGGRNDERVDRHGAVGADPAEQMSSDPRRPHPLMATRIDLRTCER